jgi:uncharacterized protein (DUF2384 family)
MIHGTWTFDPTDLGTIRNHLHLLTEDRRHLRADAFRSVTGLSPSEMARSLGVHRPRLYQSEIALERDLRKRILTLVRALDLAYELLGKDAGKTRVWVMAPNDFFGDDSPFEVIMQGHGNQVVDFLLERAGKKAGAAF